uniref:Uncharacterized protein n=1 Tax=Oncorhynchus tshawytscha TaxID=74940 RepID=A0A8C8HZ86_ONCTS
MSRTRAEGVKCVCTAAPVSSLIISLVSSVLNRDVKQSGKKYMTHEEVCWNSDQSFRVSELKVQFQGGFSGCPKDGDLAKIIDFYPEDSSSLQISFNEVPTVHRLQIVFENSADFFGRIIVYSLDILGERAL